MSNYEDGDYVNMYDVKLRNQQLGKFFFSGGAMKAFSSITQEYAIWHQGGVLFVESTRYENEGRLYSAMYMDWATGDVKPAFGSQRREFTSSRQARGFINRGLRSINAPSRED